jgi:uncharacterized protein YwqG
MSLNFESRERVLDALSQAGLARLVPLVKPCVRLTASNTPDLAIPIGASKIGGSPDLPEGFAWPQHDGAPLSFVVQVDLLDAARLPGTEILPPDGRLSVFYDTENYPWGGLEDVGSWAVVYTAADQPLRRHESLTDAFPMSSRLSFSPSVSLPPSDAIELETLELDEEEAVAFVDLTEAFMTEDSTHQLLGDPDEIQNEMQRECALLAEGIDSSTLNILTDSRAQALKAAATQWRLLMQIDSDDEAGTMWGDTGMLYFWIREDDLRERRFDRVWMIMQCC